MLWSLLLALAWPSLWAAQQAASGPEVTIQSRTTQPGEMLLIVVKGQQEGHAPSGRFLGAPLVFFPASAGTFLAFAGLDLDVSTGAHHLELELAGSNGVPHYWGSDMLVEPKAFPTQELKVEEKYVKPPKEEEERAERESARLRRVFATTTPKRFFKGSFVSPIAGAPSSRFGERRVFNGAPKSPHGGADLRAKSGTKVRAPAGGRVALADDLFYAGKTVVLDHGFGLFTYYAHLSKIKVKPGKIVSRGTVLGRVGATGRVTGPHLHWAVKLHEARIDPFSLAALDLDAWLNPRRPPAK